MPTVSERVKKVIIDQLGVEGEQVIPTASFTDDLNADSLDLVELVMGFEEEFSTPTKKFEISDEEAQQIKTVQDTVDFIKARGVDDE